ncbi:MAG: hypothetical protein Q9219_006351 [cf. Caloplaca sp. 3 TL-2023]
MASINSDRKSQGLNVPLVTRTSFDSDVSDDESVFSREIDSTATSDTEPDHIEVVKRSTTKKVDVAIPTPEVTEPVVQEETPAQADGETRSVNEISESIMEVLGRYRLIHQNDANKPWKARARFLNQVQGFVTRQEPVSMALPAFPFKSPNKATKVLGSLPDMGEQISLLHLQGVCSAIKGVYKQGGEVYIVSDGLMYNDILGITDAEVYRYSQALQQMAKDCGCNDIKFLPFTNLLGGVSDAAEPTTEEAYLKDVSYFRDQIMERYTPEGFNVESHLAKDADATLTYRGYIKFLETDLATRPADAEPKTKSQMKKMYEEIAKKMMVRGKAFAASIAQNVGGPIRLSIHASTEVSKLSMSLIPQVGKSHTPWHSSLSRAIDGSITMNHAASVPAMTHDLICDKEGRPSYFRERSPLFHWSEMEVNFDYQYPGGMVISPRDPNTRYTLNESHIQKVRALAEKCSPVILQGFADSTEQTTFEATKA